MAAPSLFCPDCGKHTPHQHQVDSFATFCTICGHKSSQLERAETEANTYTAPDGEPGVLVRNDNRVAIFYIEKGQYAGYYVYDKATGYGAIQNTNSLPPVG
jgi:hypothetical protein